MPTYPFVCRRCGKSFEMLLDLAQRDAPQVCPHCGSKRTSRDICAGLVGRQNAKESAPRACGAPS